MDRFLLPSAPAVHVGTIPEFTHGSRVAVSPRSPLEPDSEPEPMGTTAPTIFTDDQKPTPPSASQIAATGDAEIVNEGLDYSHWTAAWFRRFPGCELANSVKINGWFWAHGYRLVHRRSGKKPSYLWVCSICVAKNRPPPRKKYTFVSDTQKSIRNHLLEDHRIRRPLAKRTAGNGGQLTAVSSKDRPSVASLLQLDMGDPTVQDTVARIQSLYKEELFWLLLLDWIVHDNHSFRMVQSQRFRRVCWSLNPSAQIPSHQTLANLLVKEYHKAVVPVRQLLRTARGMIHLTFDGWTSRQNTCFIGVHAYFVDQDWKQWKVMLGMPPLIKRHTGEDLAQEVSAIIEYFEIGDR